LFLGGNRLRDDIDVIIVIDIAVVFISTKT